MERKLEKNQGTLVLSSCSQTEFTIEERQADAIVTALKAARDSGFRFPIQNEPLVERDVYMEVGDIKVLPPANEYRVFAIHNKSTNSWLWVKSRQHAISLIKLYEEHTQDIEEPITHLR